MLNAIDVAAVRGSRTVIDKISVALSPGEVLGVMGANGAGKSTLLAVLAGELAITAGAVALDNVELKQLSPQALARRRAVLPQAPTLSFDLAVTEVVAMGAYPFPEATPGEVRRVISKVLDLADAVHLQDRRYLQLSGGEQQRVQLARVLMQTLIHRQPHETRYLLLDEPTASLDPRHQQRLMSAAAELAHAEGLGVLAVLHDVNLAARWCDRLLLLAEGRALACGTPEVVLTPHALQAAYDVEATVFPHPRAPQRPLVLFD
jgi:iron complex transport system ATP-binding protein